MIFQKDQFSYMLWIDIANTTSKMIRPFNRLPMGDSGSTTDFNRNKAEKKKNFNRFFAFFIGVI